jgi:hypothetical protein
MQNARFIIQKTIKHGDGLVCSYPTCQAGGVKFRMCTHCNFPVAKRRGRHHHCQDETTPTATNEERGSLLVQQNETALPLSHRAAASKISVCLSQNDVERSMMPSHWGHPSSTQPSRQEKLVDEPALQFTLLQTPNALDPNRHDGTTALKAEHASSKRTASELLEGFYQQGLGREATLLRPGMSKSEQKLANSDPIGMANLVDHSGKASSTADSTASLRTTKAEQLQAGPRGTVVIPCRARGMPPDHNSGVSILFMVVSILFCFHGSQTKIHYSIFEDCVLRDSAKRPSWR